MQAQGEYGTLAVSEASGGVLAGTTPVKLRHDVVTRAGASGSRATKRSAADALAEGDRTLFEALRTWRAQTAREQGVPAYVVFGDATLRALAEHRPARAEDLVGISGIGEKKREAYGEAVLEVIAAEG
jgi:ATP-dependent DNA helicase RecQ